MIILKKLSNIEKNLVNSFDTKKVKLIHLSSAKVTNKIILLSAIMSGFTLKPNLTAKRLLKKILKYVILRPPLIYGPNVRANFTLMKAVDRGLPLPFAKYKKLKKLSLRWKILLT